MKCNIVKPRRYTRSLLSKYVHDESDSASKTKSIKQNIVKPRKR